jgi:RHS repeat-associated protein
VSSGKHCWQDIGLASNQHHEYVFLAHDVNVDIGASINAADGSGAAQYEYGPFGEAIRATGPMAKANPFRFSTKYQDDETDLLYYGYRYYSASTGRWNSRDPIWEKGGYDPLEADRDSNFYAFADNTPISSIDHLGLITFSSGCTERQKQRIGQAFDTACSKAKSCLHRYCMDDRSVSRELKKTCDSRDLHIVCHQRATRLNGCRSPISGDERCGWTAGGSSVQPWHTIHLCPGAFDDPAGCGELGCTVLHEMTHAAGAPSEDEAQRSEICSGMDCVTVPGIKTRDLSRAPSHVSPCWCGREE